MKGIDGFRFAFGTGFCSFGLQNYKKTGAKRCIHIVYFANREWNETEAEYHTKRQNILFRMTIIIIQRP